MIHTNTVEGFYSVFERGMKGIYQHCAEKHLHRYVAEFDSATTTAFAWALMMLRALTRLFVVSQASA